MSGTSLDGVDAVLVSEDCQQVLADYYLPYAPELKEALLNLTQSGQTSLANLAKLDRQVAEHFAKAARYLIEQTSHKVQAIGSHGQSIYHQGGVYSQQIGHGALIAELTGVTVVSDFRMADVAAGGQGAPLTPLYHQYLLNGKPGMVINLGGIANLTMVDGEQVIGFDSGPANTLMDNWIRVGSIF